jgi:hypothetical protein
MGTWQWDRNRPGDGWCTHRNQPAYCRYSPEAGEDPRLGTAQGWYDEDVHDALLSEGPGPRSVTL